MASLSDEKRKKTKRKKTRFTIGFMILSLFITPYLAAYIDQFFLNNQDIHSIKVNYLGSFMTLFSNEKQLMIFGLLEALCIVFLFYIMTLNYGKVKSTETNEVADGIKTPVAVGQGQFGTNRFMTNKEKREIFYTVINQKNKDLKIAENAGLVIGMEKENGKEVISCIANDVNSILIGATRSGKTRRQILETIWLRGLTGKSMVVTDVKGELYLYSHKYLEKQGYEVIDFDLRQPKKSKRYNYMTQINKAVKERDIPKAIDYTWDLVSVMVGLPKGEPLWTNGESSVIAACILLISIEAPEKYKNLTNVYYFIAKMCKSDEIGRMPITVYFNSLPDTHPAKGLFDVAELSPEKMRGSFFGMALTTLRLFTNWNIADLTKETYFDITQIGKKKTAFFIIVHDEKTTYYPLVSLLMNQIYSFLVETASRSGGRLPVEVDMIWDEVGNFPEVPGLGTQISAGLSRGIRYILVIQDFQQLEKKYKEDFSNIKGNCDMLVFLKSKDLKTKEEISKQTGTYTIEVGSVSSSSSGKAYSNNNYSNNANMQSRALLLPDEVGRIKYPNALILYGVYHPAIFNAPDLSDYEANEIFGLGNEEFNKKVIMERDNDRPEREISEIELWGIWKEYEDRSTIDNEEKAEPEGKRVSFLDI